MRAERVVVWYGVVVKNFSSPRPPILPPHSMRPTSSHLVGRVFFFFMLSWYSMILLLLAFARRDDQHAMR